MSFVCELFLFLSISKPILIFLTVESLDVEFILMKIVQDKKLDRYELLYLYKSNLW